MIHTLGTAKRILLFCPAYRKFGVVEVCTLCGSALCLRATERATAWARVVRGSGLLYTELYANDGPSVTTPLTPTVLRDGDEGSGSENQ